MLNLKPTGNHHYSFRLLTKPHKFYVGIHIPGVLQCFMAGPLDVSDVKNGVVVVDVPQPAAIEAGFSLGSEDVTEIPFRAVNLKISWRIPGSNSLWRTLVDKKIDHIRPLRVADLAPGSYWVGVRTVPKEGVKTIENIQITPGLFWDSRTLNLQAGETAVAAFEYTRLNRLLIKRSPAEIVKMLAQDGSPTKWRQVKITYRVGHYGRLNVFTEAVPDDGILRINGITESVSDTGAYDLYVVFVNERSIGSFRVEKETTPQTFEFRLAPDRGDLAPNVELTDVESETKVRLADLRGRIVFLEFWASWCGPCQPAMDNLNRLAAETTSDWGNEVVVASLSVDDKFSVAKRYVQRRGWTNIKHFWSGGEKTGRQSPGAKAFAVSGVPVALLINRDGRIVWRGRPMDTRGGQDVRSRVNSLLPKN